MGAICFPNCLTALLQMKSKMYSNVRLERNALGMDPPSCVCNGFYIQEKTVCSSDSCNVSKNGTGDDFELKKNNRLKSVNISYIQQDSCVFCETKNQK